MTASCKNGTGFKDVVITDEKGIWSGKVDETKLPCALQVENGTQPYHSYANAAGNVNITPFTDISIALATGQPPSDWYKHFTNLNETQLEQAQKSLNEELLKKGYAVPENFDLFKTNFQIGDMFDLILDKFKAASDKAIQSGSLKDYNALINLIKSGGLQYIPVFLQTTVIEGQVESKFILKSSSDTSDRAGTPPVWCSNPKYVKQTNQLKLDPLTKKAYFTINDGGGAFEVVGSYNPDTGAILIQTSEHETSGDNSFSDSDTYSFTYTHFAYAPDTLLGTINSTRQNSTSWNGQSKTAVCKSSYEYEGQFLEQGNIIN